MPAPTPSRHSMPQSSSNWGTSPGITPPPTGLDFLKNQGAWYTPFIHPNLKDRYDLRGLHADAARKDGS